MRASQKNNQRALHADEAQHASRPMPGEVAGRDHGIDDLRANKGDAGRQQTGQQRQQRQRDQQRSIGAPDQVDRAAAVAKDAKEATP